MGLFGKNSETTAFEALREQTTPTRGAGGLQKRRANEKLGKKNKTDGRTLRATGRTVQMNMRAKPEIKELLFDLADQEGVVMSEIVERALLAYAEKTGK